MQHLISPKALAAEQSTEQSTEPPIEQPAVIFDCRFSLTDKEAGYRAYAAGHIPGARFANLERDLSGMPGAGGRHPLPDRGVLAERLGAWGVGNQTSVVCYDQNSGALAGRLWWLTRWLGHADVRVLDGGLDAWIAAGLATDAATVVPVPAKFTPGAPLTRTCAAADLAGASLNLLDAREAVRYRGEAEPIDPVAGHIPGAISAPFADNLAGARFKSPDALRSRFEALELKRDLDNVCYCGSGITATHNILALLLAGYPEPVLYPGSWSEWIADPRRPVAR